MTAVEWLVEQFNTEEIRYIKSVGYEYVFFRDEETLIRLGHKDLVHILNISKSVTIKHKVRWKERISEVWKQI